MSKSLLRTVQETLSPGSDNSVLILGGTAEARELAELLAADGRLRVITSLAGRTENPPALPGAVRIGGFGGADAMAEYIRANTVALIIDATHPFAERISANAGKAARETGVARIALVRPPWKPDKAVFWTAVPDIAAARDTIPDGAKVMLAIGSQHVGSFGSRKDVGFVARMIDEPENPPFQGCRVVTGRPGATIAEEKALMELHAISHLVCRNSGGSAGTAKLRAAVELGIEIIMIEQPPMPPPPHAASPREIADLVISALSS